jgi:hypothetical protein
MWAALCKLGAREGTPLDLAALDGTWRLCYTSASDVLVLFEAAERLPLLQVFLSLHRCCWFLVAIAIRKPTESHHLAVNIGCHYLGISHISAYLILGSAG